MEPLHPYDVKKLKEARAIIERVYEYYYSAPGFATKVKRLETILKKIDELLSN